MELYYSVAGRLNVAAAAIAIMLLAARLTPKENGNAVLLAAVGGLMGVTALADLFGDRNRKRAQLDAWWKQNAPEHHAQVASDAMFMWWGTGIVSIAVLVVTIKPQWNWGVGIPALLIYVALVIISGKRKLPMADLEPIQAPGYTADGRKSHTELARVVAAHKGWMFTRDDRVSDNSGRTIARSIEDAAEAMSHLGWITNHVMWNDVPDNSRAAADALRAALTADGAFQRPHG